MYQEIDKILNTLREGDISIINDCAPILNKFINDTINKNCSEKDIEYIDKVLRICNILYNRTDIDLLPVEDGVYDLLLEKYKTYNPDFQVGSEIVNFKDYKITNSEEKQSVKALKFYDTEELDKIKDGFFYKELYSTPNLNPNDFKKAPLYCNGTISKRTHNTQHEHPDLVGTLDKCKFVLMEEAINKGVADDNNVKVLERDFFANHISKGILDPNRKISMVLELKYDGISVEADCTNVVVSARNKSSDFDELKSRFGEKLSFALQKVILGEWKNEKETILCELDKNNW